jgi:hypothetical protein
VCASEVTAPARACPFRAPVQVVTIPPRQHLG